MDVIDFRPAPLSTVSILSWSAMLADYSSYPYLLDYIFTKNVQFSAFFIRKQYFSIKLIIYIYTNTYIDNVEKFPQIDKQNE